VAKGNPKCRTGLLKAMSDVFAEEEAAEEKRFTGTNPVDWIRMVFLQLLRINCFGSFFFSLFLEVLSPTSFEHASPESDSKMTSKSKVKFLPLRDGE